MDKPFNPLPHEPLKTQLELAIENLEEMVEDLRLTTEEGRMSNERMDKSSIYNEEWELDEEKIKESLKVSLGLLKEYKKAEESKNVS